MREQFLELLKTIQTISYKISEELPFSNSGTPLYSKNPRRIYVDTPTNSIEVFMQILNGVNIDSDVLTIRVYFANDAKQLPTDYQSTVDQIKKLKDSVIGDFIKRQCTYSLEFENDMIINRFEFNFTSIYKE